MIKQFFFSALFVLSLGTLGAQKTTLQEVAKICDGLSPSEKPVVAVMPFKIAAEGAGRAVGEGLPDMLANAIFNTGCFRVVDRERLDDIIKQQGLGLSGAVDESSSPQIGKLSGAQVLVFGTVTKFKENESGGGGGLFKAGRGVLGKLGAAVGSGKSTTSLLGYSLKFIDATTGEYLDSKSFDEKVTSVGLAGSGIGVGGSSVGGGGGSFFQNKSMQDAIEKSLIEAVEYMSRNKTAYTSLLNSARQTTSGKETSFTKTDCPLLKAKTKPSIVVILPEEHVTGAGGAYDPYRHRIDITINAEHSAIGQYISTAPCQAGETEIASKLTEAGFHLKDASQLEELKKQAEFQNAYKNPSDASKIGSRYNVDIIIVGDAFSEYFKKTNGLVSCRATVSVKAVMRNDASVVAAKSFKGSGLDASELVAGKTALENACAQIADYLRTQFCTNGDEIISSMNAKEETGGNLPVASYKAGSQPAGANKGDVLQQQPREENFYGRKSRETTIQVTGLMYEQYKSLMAAIEKTKGIGSIASQGYAMTGTSLKVATVLTPDELIENIKKWNPKLNFYIGMATDEIVMMSITDGK